MRDCESFGVDAGRVWDDRRGCGVAEDSGDALMCRCGSFSGLCGWVLGWWWLFLMVTGIRSILAATIEAEGVTMMHFVPSMMGAFVAISGGRECHQS